MKHLRLVRGEEWVLFVLALGVCVLVLAPILVVFGQSLVSDSRSGASFRGFDNYVTAFSDPWVRAAIVNTLFVSLGTTVFATVVGVSLAWLNARTNMPGRRFLEAANIVPFFLSPFVGAIAWMDLAAPRVGYLNQLARAYLAAPGNLLNIYGPGGIVWVQGVFFAPMVYLMTVGMLRHMDPSLEESSRACGCGVWTTAWRVTLPLMLPAALSGAILVFVSSAGEFGVPLALGSPHGFETLSTQIFEVLQRTQPRYDLAATMGALLLATTIALVIAYRRIILARDYVTVSGKGYRPAVLDLGAWRYVAFLWNAAYVAVAVALPLLALFAISMQKLWLGALDITHLTLENYSYVLFANPATRSGIEHSLFLAVTGALLGVGLSIVTSRVIYRSRLPARQWIDIITSIPAGVPGIVLAIGALMLFIRTPLYGTLTVLLLAYVARFIPVGQRSVSGALLAVSPELEECSRACGAGWTRTVARITVPLLKPGLVAAWMLLFVIFLRELPISILLWTSGTEVMSVALYQMLEHATAGQTAAYAIVQAAIILVVLAGFAIITGRQAQA